jgi:hypothetical protein
MRHTPSFYRPGPTSPLPGNNGKAAGSDRGVLLSATEFFAGRPRHDIEEKRIFLELARNLLAATSIQHRRRISALLAGHGEIPADLLEQLANDEDELTAYPPLRYSPGLSVDLLLAIASRGPESLRRAIANRPSLPESLVGALCEHAGPAVIRILLDRDDLVLAKGHLDRLGRRSDIVAALGMDLAGQDALTPDGLMGQFLHLPAPLKARAIAAAETVSLVRQAQAPAGASRRKPHSASLRVQDALMGEALAQNRPRFADLLSRELGLAQPTCDLLLREDQSDGLVIAMRAVGMTRAQLATVLIRLVGEDLSLDRLRDLLRLHRSLSSGAAEVLVSQWLLQDENARQETPRHAPQYQEGIGRDRPETGNTAADGAAAVLPLRSGER